MRLLLLLGSALLVGSVVMGANSGDVFYNFQESQQFVFGKIPEEAISVSMLELIVYPEKYNGKFVRFRALLREGGGRSGILGLDTPGFWDTANSIRPRFTQELNLQGIHIINKRVDVAGRYDYLARGDGNVAYRELTVVYLRVVGNSTDFFRPYVFGKIPEEAIEVSMIELIVNPLKYKGKHVRFEALITVPTADRGFLYLNTDGLRDSANSIGFAVPEGLKDRRGQISGNWGAVSGRFNCIVRRNGEVLRREVSIDYLEVKLYTRYAEKM